MKVKRKDLVTGLSSVKPGLASKDIVEANLCFMFTGKRLVTFNDQISIQYPFDSDFEGLVPSQEFLKIVSEVNCDEIELAVEEETLTIKGAGLSAELSMVKSEDSSIADSIIDPADLDWKPLPEDFLTGAELCMFSATKDMTLEVLTCLLVKDSSIMSSDNLRVSRYEMNGEVGVGFLIPATSIPALIKFGVTQWSLDKAWVYFKTENDIVFCSRVMTGEFPDTSGLFDVEGDKFKLPSDIKKAIEVSSIMAEGEYELDKKIDVVIEEGTIKCRGEKDVGWVETEATFAMRKGRSAQFSINPDFFSHILDYAAMVTIGNGTILFKTSNFSHVIALFGGQQ